MFSAGQFSTQKGFLSDMSDSEMKPSELVDMKENFVSKSQSQFNLKASPSLLSTGFDRIPGDFKSNINGKQLLQEEQVNFILKGVVKCPLSHQCYASNNLFLTCLLNHVAD